MTPSFGRRKIAVGCRGQNWRSRRAWLSCAAASLAIALAGCVAAVPTEAEVLDGTSFATRRESAAAKVHSVAGTIASDAGISKVGEQRSHACTYGHNDMKRHDGYGLKCDSFDTVFLAWSGDFTSRSAQIERVVSRGCSVANTMLSGGPPTPGFERFGLEYSCPEGVSVDVSYSVASPFDDSNGFLNAACDAVNVRCGDSDVPREIAGRAQFYDWVARIAVQGNVYTEVIN